MNAAKDRKTNDMRAYLEGTERQALINNLRYTEDMSIKVSPPMIRDIAAFAEKHGVNKSEVIRACVNESLETLDKRLTRAKRNLAR